VTPSLLHRLASRAIALAAVFVWSVAAPCWAQPGPQAAEVQVKAAFLYKFLSFVEWPAHAFASDLSSIVIGVVGADALADELAAVVAQRTAQGRPVRVRKLRPGESVAGVHLLFLGRAEGSRAAGLVASAKGLSLLIVSDSDEAFANGSAINFVVVDNKLRFDVALRPAERGNLKISSRLLAVARKVISNPS
jgi:hypothetical protein